MGAKSERALILRTRVLGDMGDTIGDCSPEPSTSELSSSAARAAAKALMWLHGALNQHCSEHPLVAAYSTLRQRSLHPSRRRAERYWCAFQERSESRVGRGWRLGLAGFDRRPKTVSMIFLFYLYSGKMHPNASTLATRTADLFRLHMCLLGIRRLGGSPIQRSRR